MIKDLDELAALLKLCRKQGITAIKLEGVEISFGELPRKINKEDEVPTDEPTAEELINWSIQRENI